MGAYTRKGQAALERDAADDPRSCFPILSERRDQLAGTLSGGEQQMLAIGRGLASAPELLMLDEPSMGLAPTIVDAIFERIHLIHKNGLTILLVEQRVAEALESCDRGYVLETGRVVDGRHAQDADVGRARAARVSWNVSFGMRRQRRRSGATQQAQSEEVMTTRRTVLKQGALGAATLATTIDAVAHAARAAQAREDRRHRAAERPLGAPGHAGEMGRRNRHQRDQRGRRHQGDGRREARAGRRSTPATRPRRRRTPRSAWSRRSPTSSAAWARGSPPSRSP